MNKKINLKTVSDELGLTFFNDQASGANQDWALINGSQGRMEEFIEYFNSHGFFPDRIKYELFELIIASFNEDLLENVATKEKELLFKRFIKKNSHNPLFKPILSYWKGVTNTEELPIGKFL